MGRAADLNDNFRSISDLVGGAAAGGGIPPGDEWPSRISVSGPLLRLADHTNFDLP